MAENESAKLYYTIGEVAKLLEVNPSLIRYWEKEFSSIRPRKNRRGNRLFTIKDIEQLRYIYHLVKIEGHTLDGARKLLRDRESESARTYSLINTLEDLKQFLKDLRNELDKNA